MTNLSAITPHPIIQICYAVDDLESAARRWAQTTGAGPFLLIPHLRLKEVTYRGKPAQLDQSSAFGQWGALQVELFRQHCDNPSGLRDMFAPGEGGLQHITWLVDDLDVEARRLNDLGFATVMTAWVGRLHIAWFDTRSVVGAMVEVYEECEQRRVFYHKVAQAAEGWNGEDPFRPYPST